MNAVIILLLVMAWFTLGYFAYSRFLEGKLFGKLDAKKTPAKRFTRNPDYKPTKKEILFGHHFASIAGAGPIIGPILAVSYFGWLAVILWISLGTFIIGAVHDYLTLMISVKHDGKGIAKISENTTGKRTFYVFSIILWLTLMLIITVFAVSSADSLIQIPELVIPFIGITLAAVLLGLMIYKIKMNRWIASLITIAIVILSIYLGIKFPLSLPFTEHTTKIVWISILFVYCLVASLLPVWFLLQPRDYLSSVNLFFFLILGLLAIIISRPVINAPIFIVSNLPLWPILFITVACGAVSGFHALVSSGTTPKQIEKEKDVRFVGYGAMVAEGIVALIVTIAVVAGLSWTPNIPGNFTELLGEGWIIAFGTGFANIVNNAFSFIPKSLLIIIGSLIVNIFILTSLDTSTRIGRMLSSEAIPRKKLKNKFILTIAILIPAFILAITNSYASIWRMFGASNQLIAAVVLLVISAYLAERRKPIKYSLVPAIFMLATTLAALFYGLFNKNGYIFGETNILLIIISIILIIFAIIVSIEAIVKILKKRK